MPGFSEPLTVAIRVRPMNKTEYKAGAKQLVYPVDDKLIVLMDPNEETDDILRANRSREKHYVFDMVFNPDATQEDMYRLVEEKNMIDNVLSGFNCAVFAYGATGTGKTHTMLGTHEEPGIMVHTLNNLFRRIEETKGDIHYQVSMGYLEIYNELVRDLLCPDSGSLELREDANGSITITNLLDISASSTDVILGMLRMGNKNRTSEPTFANKTSSRSHAILKISVEQHSRSSSVKQQTHCGSLYLVDLAGSERARVSKNRGQRQVEGAHINRSLLALANCINALGSNSQSYVNYRDSKLTRILKEALGGNCKTMMIAHISPASTSYEETRNTMVYAERSKKIKNKAHQNVVDVNRHVTQYLHIIEELQGQVIRLRQQLDNKSNGTVTESLEVTKLCNELKAFAVEQKEIRHGMLDIECSVIQNLLDYRKQMAIIEEWEKRRDVLDPAATTATSSVNPSPSLTPDPPILVKSDSSNFEQPISDNNPSPTKNARIVRLYSQTCSCGRHLTTRNDSITLKQAGNVLTSTPKKITSTTAVIGSDDERSIGEASSGGGAFNYRLDNASPLLAHGLLQSVSPDSGAEMSLTVPGIGDQPEPLTVSAAREEVATLTAEKQKLLTQHKRLEKRLKENKACMAVIKKKLTECEGFLPLRKEMVSLLEETCDLDSLRAEHSHSSMVMGMHLTQHLSLIDRLLHQCSLLTSMLAQHRSLMTEGGAGGRVEIPEELTRQFGELSDKQKRLTAEVAEIKMLTIDDKSEMQQDDRLKLPSISRLSKFSINREGTSDDEQTNASSCSHADISVSSNEHFPTISPLRHSQAAQNPHSQAAQNPDNHQSEFTSLLSLPPVNNSHQNKSPAEEGHKTHKKTSLKHSEIAHLLDAAKKSRDERIAGTLDGERIRRTRTKKLPVREPAKLTTFLPWQNNETKFDPPLTHGNSPTVIDLESNEASTSTSLKSHPLQTKSVTMLHGQKAKSYLDHSSPSKATQSMKHVLGEQNLKPPMTHRRVGKHPYTKSAQSSHQKAKFNKLVSNKSRDFEERHSKLLSTYKSPAHKDGSKQTLSKPILRKSFAQMSKSPGYLHGGGKHSMMFDKTSMKISSQLPHSFGNARTTNKTRGVPMVGKRKRPLLPRKELQMARVRADDQFPSSYHNLSLMNTKPGDTGAGLHIKTLSRKPDSDS